MHQLSILCQTKSIFGHQTQNMPPFQLPDPALFAFDSPIHIRWADIDALQHVNNAVYLSYFEQARIDYFREVVKWDWDALGMILASNTIHYLAPLFARDKARILMRSTRLGSKSFEMEYLVEKQTKTGPKIITFASAVLVAYDYRNDQTVALPEAYRQAIEQFEPGLSAAKS